MTGDVPFAPGVLSTEGHDALLALAVRETPEGIAILSEEGLVRFANPAFVAFVGRPAEAVMGASIDVLRAARGGDRLTELVPDDGEAWEGDLVRADRVDEPLELAATVRRIPTPGGGTAVLVVARDVTRMRLLERRMADAQRMDTLGHLAGGVAHDFNNILSVITTLSDLLLRVRAEDDPDREDLEEIFRSARRGSEITRQLSAFNRTGSAEPGEVDLNGLLRNHRKMFRRLLPEDVEVAWELDEHVPVVFADPLHLDQLVLNLSINAREAMPGGGELRIATGSRRLAGPEEVGGVPLPPGLYATLEVRDSGAGMDPEALRRIFEPFFATPGGGERRGPGLSMVYGTVRAAGGAIEVESQPGRGTRFRILLPAHRPPDARAADPALPGGPETLLVVEDHPELRRGFRRFFGELGYVVLDAADGAEALALVEGGLRPDLVASDVVMPSLGGLGLEAGIRGLGLSVPMVFFSGYADHPDVDRLRRSGVPVIPKPVDMARLAREIRELLDPRAEVS